MLALEGQMWGGGQEEARNSRQACDLQVKVKGDRSLNIPPTPCASQSPRALETPSSHNPPGPTGISSKVPPPGDSNV